MFDNFLFQGLIIVLLLVASESDIKHRVVPNYTSLLFIPIGILSALFLNDFLNWSFGFVIAVMYGYGLWLMGSWGGADAKIMFGLGGILGLQDYMIFKYILLKLVIALIWFSIMKLQHKKVTNFPFVPVMTATYTIIVFSSYI